MCPAAVPILENALERSKGSDRLFPKIKDEDGLNTVSGRISKITKAFDKKSGYKISIHSLRVQHASTREEKDCPEELAVKVAGHRQLSLT